MPTRSVAWPVAPRPFDGEAYGSWFGRIAARYQIGVDELAAAAGVGLEDGGRAWLASQPPRGEALVTLAALCRLPTEVIGSMGPSEPVTAKRLWYCYACLDMNPEDVSSPYWRTAWLDPQHRPCTTHRGDAWWIATPTLLRYRNMSKLVGIIRQRMQQPTQRRRRQDAGLYPYIRRV
jgi:hypothetical protein